MIDNDMGFLGLVGGVCKERGKGISQEISIRKSQALSLQEEGVILMNVLVWD